MKKGIYGGVLLVGLIIILSVCGALYYFSGEDTGLGDRQTREQSALNKASELSRVGDIAEANEVYVDLIKSTDDDIVLERSIRDYGRNLAKDGDMFAALKQNIALASNPRVRATARAGAVENLARAYLFDTGISETELSQAIFSETPFSQLKSPIKEDIPEYVLLLEYGNSLSVRPLATAILAEYYAQELYAGIPRAQRALEDALAILDALVPQMSQTNPVKPLVLSYETSALLYAASAGVYFEHQYIDQVFNESLKASSDVLEPMFEILDSNLELGWTEESLLSQYYAHTTQFTIVFKTLLTVPVLNQGESIMDVYVLHSASQAPPALLAQYAQELLKKYDRDSD